MLLAIQYTASIQMYYAVGYPVYCIHTNVFCCCLSSILHPYKCILLLAIQYTASIESYPNAFFTNCCCKNMWLHTLQGLRSPLATNTHIQEKQHYYKNDWSKIGGGEGPEIVKKLTWSGDLIKKCIPDLVQGCYV